MTYDTARMRIILYSLIITGFLLPFFFLAPAMGYPLSSDQSRQTLSLMVPVFLGYLGSGLAFVFNPPKHPLPVPNEKTITLLGLLLNGAFALFVLGFASLIFAFGYSNRSSAPPGAGMDFPSFSNGITVILGVMTTVIGGAVIYLFGIQSQEREP